MIVVTVYVIKDDPVSQTVLQDLDSLQNDFPHQLAVVDIDANPDLQAAYRTIAPVVQAGPYRLQTSITRQELQVVLGAARDRAAHLDKIGDPLHAKKVKRGHNLSGADRVSFWLSRHYMLLINLLLGIYVGLPFLSPVLASQGQIWAARAIQTIYSPLCHQLAYRSWFLFGEQPYYPRDLAAINTVGSYEEMIGGNPADLLSARKFIGSEEIGFGAGKIGYKVVLCERDVAIYGAMFLFGLIFSLARRKIRIIPWYFWILFGLVPIGIDGASQLPGLIQALPDWMIMRESTPLLRTISGGLFGLTTAWYLFPLIEESMHETRKLLAGKIAVIPQLRNNT